MALNSILSDRIYYKSLNNTSARPTYARRLPQRASMYSAAGAAGTNQSELSTANKKFGNASLYFDGVQNWMRTEANTTLYTTSGDWTIEFWFYRESFKTQSDTMFMNSRMTFQHSSNIGGRLSFYDVVDYDLGNINVGQWYHFAATMNNRIGRVFIDGVKKAEYGRTQDSVIFSQCWFGRHSTGAYWNGFIDEIRYSRIARYTADFTPQTEPHVNDEHTMWLYHCNIDPIETDLKSLVVDDNYPYTRVPKTVTAYNGGHIATSVFKTGNGSLSCGSADGGTNQYYGIASSTDFAFSSGTAQNDYTIEGWFRPSSAFSGTVTFWDSRNTSSAVVGWLYWSGNALTYATGSTVRMSYALTSTGWLNTWNHVAITRQAGNTSMIINGVLVTSFTTNVVLTVGAEFRLGASNAGAAAANYFNGFIDNFRITRGCKQRTEAVTYNFGTNTNPLPTDLVFIPANIHTGVTPAILDQVI